MSPGIGKTRLLDEFPGPGVKAVNVLRGGASTADGMPPHLPVIEALNEYVVGAPTGDLRDDLGAGAPVLPRIAERLPALPPVYPINPEQERLRLYDAIAAFLGAIATRADGGLVLALDDLQWATGPAP